MADPRATLDGVFGQGGYRITSGYRSPEKNRAVGGAPNSDHLRGEAFDVVVPGMSTSQVSARMKQAGAGGYMLDEHDHVHWSYDRGQAQGAHVNSNGFGPDADIFAPDQPQAAAPRGGVTGPTIRGVTVTVGGDEPQADAQPQGFGADDDIFAPEPAAPVADPQAAAPPALPRDPMSQITGFLQNTANNSIPFYDEAQAGLGAGANLLTGRSKFDPSRPLDSLKQAFGEQRDRQSFFAEGYKAQHPRTGALASGLGMAAGAAVPFGQGINLARGGPAAMRALRGATSAATSGFLYGFGDKGPLSERLGAGNTAAALSVPFGAAGGMIGRGARIKQNQSAAEAEALAHLQEQGIKPTAETLDDLNRLLREGHSPSVAVRTVTASNLPVPVPLTMGQATGDVTQQVAEQAMRRGANGSRPAAAMSGLAASQREALRGNVHAIGEQIGGGAAPQPGQAGSMVSDRLNATARATRDNTRQLYDIARDQGRGVRLPADEVPVLAASLRDAVSEFVPESIPHTRAALGRLDQTGPSTELRDVYGVRTMLTNLRRAGGPEAAAAGRAVSHIDSYMSDALTRDLFAGEPGAVQRWRDAISSRRAQAVMFEDNDLVHRLTEAMPNSATRRLAVDPGDASNYIFGRDALGWVGKKNLTRDLTKLRETLGSKSPEWNAIRAEAFMRFGRQGEGAMEGTERAFSGVKFAKGWQDFTRQNPQMAGLLFTNDERSLISQLAHVSLRATSPVPGAVNHSNTATVAAQLIGRLGFLRGLPMVKPIVEAQQGAKAEREALQAISGLPRPRPQRTTAPGLLPGPSRVIGASAATLRPR